MPIKTSLGPERLREIAKEIREKTFRLCALDETKAPGMDEEEQPEREAIVAAIADLQTESLTGSYTETFLMSVAAMQRQGGMSNHTLRVFFLAYCHALEMAAEGESDPERCLTEYIDLQMSLDTHGEHNG